MERLSQEPGAMDLRWSKVLLVASGWLDWYEQDRGSYIPGYPTFTSLNQQRSFVCDM